VFRSALLILSGNAAASLLLLARNLIIARLIPVEDYGIAATLAVAMSVVEMMSAFGLQQQIVQSKDGDDPRFQAALQGFQMLRGVFSGIVLFLLARPMADFLNIPQAAWAYQVLAVVPVLNAAVHFDIHRLNRRMVFGPMILTGAIPALVSLLAVWPLAQWYGDYKVMLYAILLQAGISVLTSHLVAERRWKVVFDRAIIADSLRFGWPLLANGILLFAVFNGDKFVVGRILGMEALAIFAMGVTLTLTPTLVMAKSAQNFFLPKLSRLNEPGSEGEAQFAVMARIMIEVAVLNGAILVLGAVLIAAPLVEAVLGAKYAALLPLMVPFAVLHGLRVCKAGPAIVALSRGQSGNAMVANLPRAAFLPISYLVVQGGGNLMTLIWLGIVAELCGFAVSLGLLSRRSGLCVAPIVLPVAAGLALLMAASVLSLPKIAAIMPVWADDVIISVLFGAMLMTMHDVRHYFWRYVRKP